MNTNTTLKIKHIIQKNSQAKIKNLLGKYHDYDIAITFEILSEDEKQKLYKSLSAQKLSDIFAYLEEPKTYFDELDEEKTAEIISLMDTVDAVDVLKKLDEDDRENILELIDDESAEEIDTIYQYEEETIGSIISTNYITINRNDTIRAAMKKMVTEAAENDNIFILYVLNDDGTLYGAVDLKDLIIARADSNLEDIIKTNYPILHVNDLIEDKIYKIVEYDLDIIPVLDENEVFVGVLESDNIIDAYQEEVHEDYAKFAGLTEETDIEESIWSTIKKRVPWLIFLLFLGFFVSFLISGFENIIITIPVLVFFQSMLLDMSGNVGTQSLAVTIIGLNEPQQPKWKKVLGKSFVTGILLGLLVALISFISIFAFISITKTTMISEQPFSYPLALKVSGIISFSMLIAIIIANLTGILIPLTLSKLKIDPAVASGPLITTLNDLITVLVYYGLASLLLTIL